MLLRRKLMLGNLVKYRNKKVLITGHTGFKGSWLSLWLKMLGAKVIGVSDEVKKGYLFDLINLKKDIKNYYFDISNQKKLSKVILSNKPDFIFHLAAQALVKNSFLFPLDTWKANTFGTINLLESLRKLKSKCTIIIITSDKVYKNIEVKKGYKENDILGGEDPYSASKASAELAIHSYIKSFLKNNKNLSFGIARAGNVIGGGDWSNDRLIPDCIKFWKKRRPVVIRNPLSTRPWQFVLEVVYGYLSLGIFISNKKKYSGEAFNFGPKLSTKNYTVKEILKICKLYWPNIKWKIYSKNKKFKESRLLRLNSNKSQKLFAWSCVLDIKNVIFYTLEWYKFSLFKKNKKFLLHFSKSQIKQYQKYIK
ncbi:CDP-glucose 4,6-dehydratase [Candidatus Pelagibacter bacterium]|nr:CDP-glucose 4,6-dehydratase [Candidatus Pelagibacter bacterium]